MESLDKLNEKIGITLGEIVANPYEADDWEYAWTYSEEEGWQGKYTKGQTAEGDVVAKFYKTGNKIPANPTTGAPELDEYHLVIEGQGEMGSLINMDSEEYYAWVEEMFEYNGAPETELPSMFYTTELIVCDGITNIPDGCAYQAVNLKKVIIGNDVTSIGDNAFNNCMNLTNVDIGNSVTNIGEQAFAYCSSLTSVSIPEGVTSIEKFTFLHCSSLTSISIPNSVETIEGGSFADCYAMTSITIPDSVTSIGEQALGECTSLSKIKFMTTDASEISIGSGVFKGLMLEITLPEGSKIYVLSEEMKTKLEGTYDPAKTTVEVVTLEQMNTK